LGRSFIQTFKIGANISEAQSRAIAICPFNFVSGFSFQMIKLPEWLVRLLENVQFCSIPRNPPFSSRVLFFRFRKTLINKFLHAEVGQIFQKTAASISSLVLPAFLNT